MMRKQNKIKEKNISKFAERWVRRSHIGVPLGVCAQPYLCKMFYLLYYYQWANTEPIDATMSAIDRIYYFIIFFLSFSLLSSAPCLPACRYFSRLAILPRSKFRHITTRARSRTHARWCVPNSLSAQHFNIPCRILDGWHHQAWGGDMNVTTYFVQVFSCVILFRCFSCWICFVACSTT